MTRLVAAALAAVLLPPGLAACGSTGPAAPAGATRVELSDFKFTPDHLTVRAGRVVFYLVDDGGSQHDMTIAAPGGGVLAASERVQPGHQAVFTVPALAAGTYTFYCSVPGHRDAGMQGTLVTN